MNPIFFGGSPIFGWLSLWDPSMIPEQIRRDGLVCTSAGPRARAKAKAFSPPVRPAETRDDNQIARGKGRTT